MTDILPTDPEYGWYYLNGFEWSLVVPQDGEYWLYDDHGCDERANAKLLEHCRGSRGFWRPIPDIPAVFQTVTRGDDFELDPDTAYITDQPVVSAHDGNDRWIDYYRGIHNDYTTDFQTDWLVNRVCVSLDEIAAFDTHEPKAAPPETPAEPATSDPLRDALAVIEDLGYDVEVTKRLSPGLYFNRELRRVARVDTYTAIVYDETGDEVAYEDLEFFDATGYEPLSFD